MLSPIARRSLGVIGCLCVFASVLSALEHPRRMIAETPPVTGTVTDSAGAPLANAQVIAGPLNRVTTTNEAGEFAFRSLPAGAYHLTVILIGYAPGHADITVPTDGPDVRVTIRMRSSPLQLSAVQVTATPVATDPRNVAQSTVELSGQALARSLGSSIAQTLSNEPGVAVRFDGPGASAPVIRGLTGERILVLQDGNRAGDLASTSQDHSVSIDPLVAQRVEVVRGPASLLYGNNALGGVVNVISNDIPNTVPSHIEGNFAAQAESATPGVSGSGTLTVPVGTTAAFAVRGGGRRIDDLRYGGSGTLANSYFRNFYGVGALGLMGTRGNGGLAYRGYAFDYGLPSAEGEGASIEGTRHEIIGRGDVTLGSGWARSVRANGTAQWYEHDEVEPTGEIGTSFELKTQTLDVLASTRAGVVSGAVGVSGLRKQYAATGEEALTPAANSNSVGVLVYQEVPLRHVEDPDALVPRLQLGGRYDLYRIETKEGDPKFGPSRSLDFNNLSGSVGFGLPLGRGLSIAISAARAFRAPSVEELFSDAFHEATGTYDRGNPALEAETNQGVDGQIRLHSARATGQLGAYYNRVDNFITPRIVGDTTDEDGVTFPLNQFSQSDATLRGFEGRFETEVTRGIVFGILGDAVRGKLADDSPIPFLPAARLGGIARWENRRYSFAADLRHAFAQRRVPEAVIEDDPAATSTSAYTLTNVSVGVNLVRSGAVHNVTLRVDNVFDERYRDATSRIKHFAFNPGRNVSLLYRVLF